MSLAAFSDQPQPPAPDTHPTAFPNVFHFEHRSSTSFPRRAHPPTRQGRITTRPTRASTFRSTISLSHFSTSSFALFPLQIRPLASTDYERGHLSVLSVLTQTPDVGAAAWTSQFHALNSAPNTYYILVIVSRETDRIVGTGGVFVERKFLRGLGRVGHIEDIAVASEMQGKKLGLRIIQALTHIAENAGCYKTILDCSDDNTRTYRSC
jgi:glucosamine-phosphate N-acetyltransferase